MRVHADTILTGGKVFLGPGLGFADAVALWGGRVLATGDVSSIAGLAGPDTTVVELAGRLAVPGLNDAHQHMMSVGLGTFEVDLKHDGIRRIDDILTAIKERVAQAAPCLLYTSPSPRDS